MDGRLAGWFAAVAIALSAVVAVAAEPILWYDGAWDEAGAPAGKLLTDNPGWWGARVYTGVTYAYEEPPTEPGDWKKGDRTQFGGRLMDGDRGEYNDWHRPVGRRDRRPIVVVFDFKRPCSFSEVDLIATRCTNAVGAVEASADGTNWQDWVGFETTGARTRVRWPKSAGGRYVRLTFQATPECLYADSGLGVRHGDTYLDEVLVWGEGEVSERFPEIFEPAPPLGSALQFTNVVKDVVSILPMPTPHLACKPGGDTPESVGMTMVRNETESRYFAVVNGTSRLAEVPLAVTGFGGDVDAELLIGGVLRVNLPKRQLSETERIQMRADGTSVGGEDVVLDVLPFFDATTVPPANFCRRYLSNALQVRGFPSAVPLAPGQGCVILVRLTTKETKPGRRTGFLTAGRTRLPIDVDVADVWLQPQGAWIDAYGPFTRQYPFESMTRVSKDVDRYVAVGAVTTRGLPEPRTKERLFFKRAPKSFACVGPDRWTDRRIVNRILAGKFDELTDDDRQRIADGAHAFVRRARELGLSPDRYCAFLPDEPSVHNGVGIMKMAEIAKRAEPTLLIQSDPCYWVGMEKGGFAKPEEIIATLPGYNEFVDISVPIRGIASRPTLLKGLWTKPRFLNLQYDHPAGKTGREMVYQCHRLGYRGFAYYCYYRNAADAWDVRWQNPLGFPYQAVLPLEEDVALTPLYESLREAAEDFRLLDQLKASGRKDAYDAVMKRGEAAWERTHFQWNLHDPAAEDLLAVRETVIRELAR